MTIDDTISDLQKTYNFVKTGVHGQMDDFGVYIDNLNDKFIQYSSNPTCDIFSIEGPILTLSAPIGSQFDPKKVKKEVEKRLGVEVSRYAAENFKVGNYEFKYDSGDGNLKVSHGCSGGLQYREQVILVMKRMIKQTIIYLEEVKKNILDNAPQAGNL